VQVPFLDMDNIILTFVGVGRLGGQSRRAGP